MAYAAAVKPVATLPVYRTKFMLLNQPLTEPIVTPLTKYFCTNGYRRMIGPVAMQAMASFRVVEGRLETGIPSRLAILDIAAACWVMLYSIYCSGYFQVVLM